MESVVQVMAIAKTGKSIRSLVCGASHTFCIMRDASVYGWGRNDCGQTGVFSGVIPWRACTFRSTGALTRSRVASSSFRVDSVAQSVSVGPTMTLSTAEGDAVHFPMPVEALAGLKAVTVRSLAGSFNYP